MGKFSEYCELYDLGAYDLKKVHDKKFFALCFQTFFVVALSEDIGRDI